MMMIINWPKVGANRRSDAVALGVEVVTDIHRIARLALIVIIVHRRLQQERVLTLRTTHSLYTLVGRPDKH